MEAGQVRCSGVVASAHGARVRRSAWTSSARERLSCERRACPVRELVACEVGQEHSKLQNKQCVAIRGRWPETMQSRALQCPAANVVIVYLPA